MTAIYSLLEEDELKPLLLEVFREAEPQAEALIEEYVEMYKAIHPGEELSKRVAGMGALVMQYIG